MNDVPASRAERNFPRPPRVTYYEPTAALSASPTFAYLATMTAVAVAGGALAFVLIALGRQLGSELLRRFAVMVLLGGVFIPFSTHQVALKLHVHSGRLLLAASLCGALIASWTCLTISALVFLDGELSIVPARGFDVWAGDTEELEPMGDIAAGLAMLLLALMNTWLTVGMTGKPYCAHCMRWAEPVGAPLRLRNVELRYLGVLLQRGSADEILRLEVEWRAAYLELTVHACDDGHDAFALVRRLRKPRRWFQLTVDGHSYFPLRFPFSLLPVLYDPKPDIEIRFQRVPPTLGQDLRDAAARKAAREAGPVGLSLR